MAMNKKITMATIPPCRLTLTHHLAISRVMNAGPDLISPDVQFPILTRAESRRRSERVYNARGHTLTPIVDFVRQAERDVELSDLLLERIDGKRIVTYDGVECDRWQDEDKTRVEDARNEQVLQPSTFAFLSSFFFFPFWGSDPGAGAPGWTASLNLEAFSGRIFGGNSYTNGALRTQGDT